MPISTEHFEANGLTLHGSLTIGYSDDTLPAHGQWELSVLYFKLRVG